MPTKPSPKEEMLGLIEVNLDRTRHLKYTLNAFIELDDMLGINILQNPQAFLTSLSAKTMRAFLWVGLIHEDPDLTLDAVGALIQKAMTVALPEPEDATGEAADPNALAASPSAG
jgi:hypothetical protein